MPEAKETKEIALDVGNYCIKVDATDKQALERVVRELSEATDRALLALDRLEED